MCIRAIIASTEHEESWNMKYWYISFLLYTCLLETFSSNGIPPTSWAPWQWDWTVRILQWLTQLFLHTVLENQFMLSLDKKNIPLFHSPFRFHNATLSFRISDAVSAPWGAGTGEGQVWVHLSQYETKLLFMDGNWTKPQQMWTYIKVLAVCWFGAFRCVNVMPQSFRQWESQQIHPKFRVLRETA